MPVIYSKAFTHAGSSKCIPTTLSKRCRKQCTPVKIRNSISLAAASFTSIGGTSTRPLYLGLDFGTSGARAAVIDDESRLVQEVKCGYGDKDAATASDAASTWRRVLFQLISSLDPAVRSAVTSVALDGTSATALLVDPRDGTPLTAPKLYNEAQGRQVVEIVKAMAPPAHTATAPTSTLCKLLTWWLQEEEEEEKAPHGDRDVTTSVAAAGTPCTTPSVSSWRRVAAARGLAVPGASPTAATAASSRSRSDDDPPPAPLLLHQADWLAAALHGVYGSGVSDWNNALKLGYDPEVEGYPAWLADQPFAPLLPARVLPPGSPVARVAPRVAAVTGLPPDCWVCAGTTDSIAAFVAAGVTEAGQAVTSLGSTLAVKLLSTTRVDDAKYGIYSHRLGDVWLVGGASNSGGAVLRRFFSDQQLRDLTPALDPSTPTGLDYYPLPAPGERFPLADADLQPRMSPRPDSDALFLQGLFEGIARIEAAAYQRLAEMGASPLKKVLTAGGGAANPQWTLIREKLLRVPVQPAQQGEACYGAALLARQGARQVAGEARTKPPAAAAAR